MDPVAPVLLLLIGLLVLVVTLGVWQLLRRQGRSAAAHTETRSESAQEVIKPAAAPAPARVPAVAAPERTAVAPVQARVTYTKADGSTSVRNLTLYSRNLKDGIKHSLNCRQQGERVTKQFLLSGISRLELPDQSPPLELVSSGEIRHWLDQTIPVRSPEARQARTSGKAAPAAPPAAHPQPSTAAPAPAPLPTLLPDGARGFAVLDLETTGVGRQCRIVEIALVRLDPQGRITEEWETLVHPGIPIPNAEIHGIDDALVAGAPSFAEIAGSLAAKLHEHVLDAHNLRSFDGPILEAHFAQVDGLDLSLGSGVDTMPSPRVKLVDLCARHGVELDPGVAHTALGDTRALTKALQKGMAHLEPAGSAVAVQTNGLLSQPARPLTRAMAAVTTVPLGWKSESFQLNVGQVFLTTGPASTKANTDIKRVKSMAWPWVSSTGK